MSQFTQEQTTFILMIAPVIARQERLNIFVCTEAIVKICEFYTQPAEQTALDLYFYLRNKEIDRAMVVQFRQETQARQSKEAAHE